MLFPCDGGKRNNKTRTRASETRRQRCPPQTVPHTRRLSRRRFISFVGQIGIWIENCLRCYSIIVTIPNNIKAGSVAGKGHTRTRWRKKVSAIRPNEHRTHTRQRLLVNVIYAFRDRTRTHVHTAPRNT